MDLDPASIPEKLTLFAGRLRFRNRLAYEILTYTDAQCANYVSWYGCASKKKCDAERAAWVASGYTIAYPCNAGRGVGDDCAKTCWTPPSPPPQPQASPPPAPPPDWQSLTDNWAQAECAAALSLRAHALCMSRAHEPFNYSARHTTVSRPSRPAHSSSSQLLVRPARQLCVRHLTWQAVHLTHRVPPSARQSTQRLPGRPR